MDLELVQRLGTALGLGLLVGLQRERRRSPLAGIRTFALITMLGAVCALLADKFESGWIVGLGALGVAAMLVVGNTAKAQLGRPDPGITTEIAALFMFGLGAYLMVGYLALGVALGGVVALLLHFKAPLHLFVRKIGDTDVTAIMRFVLVAFVILPILPDEAYGPYEAFNPYETWLMVVLIVSISLAGYVAAKFFTQEVGALVAGVLGGTVSSTATTVSYSRRTAQTPELTSLAAVVITIASAIAFVRVLLEILVLAPWTLWEMAPPLLTMLAVMAVLSLALFLWVRGGKEELPPQSNPAELRAALIFGGLFALVRLGVAAAQAQFGDAGVYAVALLSGLHDMDAVTLSTARLVGEGTMAADVGWRVVLLAGLSNLVAKWVIAACLASGRLTRILLAVNALAVTAGLVLFAFWPGP